MSTDVKDKAKKSPLSDMASQLPLGRLKDEVSGLGSAMAQRGLSKASDGVGSLTGRLNDIAEGKSTKTKAALNVAQGDSPLKGGVKALGSKVGETVKGAVSSVGQALTGGGGGKGGKLKVTNILETVDVPVPREVAYKQWTQFEDFPTFTKKVENVKQDEDTETTWKAQIFWSHRSWKAEIIDQVPNERIVWKSTGDKGHVDGAITFHELAPDLTRITMVLEYHPKGLFEHTGNIWRAQGRRARLELKHFARHVSTNTLIHQDEVQGWPGEIHEGKVTDEDAANWNDEESGEDQDDSADDKQSESSDGQGSEQAKDKGDDQDRDESQDNNDDKDDHKGAGNGSRGGSGAKKAAKKAPAKKASGGSGSGSGGGQKGSSGNGKAPAKKTAKKAAKKSSSRSSG